MATKTIETDSITIKVASFFFVSIETFYRIFGFLLKLQLDPVIHSNQSPRNAILENKSITEKIFLWIRGRVVGVSSLGSKSPEYDPSVRPSVVKHCLSLFIIANSIRLFCKCFARKAGPSLIIVHQS